MSYPFLFPTILTLWLSVVVHTTNSQNVQSVLFTETVLQVSLSCISFVGWVHYIFSIHYMILCILLLHWVTHIFIDIIPLSIAILYDPAVIGFGQWGLTMSSWIISASQRTSTSVIIGCCFICFLCYVSVQ